MMAINSTVKEKMEEQDYDQNILLEREENRKRKQSQRSLNNLYDNQHSTT